MKQYLYIILMHFCLFYANGQELQHDELAAASDEFQAAFFDALEQKGIENYEKAIVLLEKCNTLNPENAAVNFELGKNYYELDKLQLAERTLQKANVLKPNNQWILEALFNLYHNQKKASKVIETLQNLNKINPKYANKLVEFYYRNKQYDEALALVNKLDKNGTDKKRDQLRNLIYLNGQKFEAQSKFLEAKISSQTASEADFIKLIYAYSKLNNTEKSFDTAVLFSNTYPASETPHLSLYKLYMSRNAIDKAVTSMNTVLSSKSLKDTDKSKVINDFFNFTKTNNNYLPALEKANSIYPSVSISSKIALLYTTTNNEKATSYMASIENNNATSFDELKLLGTLFLKENRIDDALKNSEKALSLYPAQPIFYLQQAKGLNLNQKAEKAIESLFFGLDYLIDNPKLERDFYIELAKAYSLLNDKKNQEKYLQKAKKLSN